MIAYGDHDYGALWDMLSSESQNDTIRVLDHVKSDPSYRESMRQKFQIPDQFLDAMPPRDFFAALMSAADRKHATMLARREKSANEAVFTRAEIEADRALVFWTSPVSGAEKMMFVLEDGRWKPVLKR